MRPGGQPPVEGSAVGEMMGRAAMRVLALVAASLLVTACSNSERRADNRRVDPRYGTSPSPRVVADGQRIAKGGGSYKIGQPYKVAGRWYTPVDDPNYDRSGVASWYGTDFHGRKTANGEVFDMTALTAAHPTMPLPSYAYVTNLANGRTVLVRVNDRGPYAQDRIIDLSRQTARMLGTEAQGLGHVRVRYAGRAPLDGNDTQEQAFLAAQPWAGALAGTQPGAMAGRMGLGLGHGAASSDEMPR
jgi:rare lipoprotein A